MIYPIATYRIQFRKEFNFKKAAEAAKYLHDLGISHIYASPILRAREGSAHGYDGIDATVINPEHGSQEEFRETIVLCRKFGIGWIQDIAPNHQAYCPDNPWLSDLLENGRCSEYYKFYDVNWDHYNESLKGKILAPFLGDYYGNALESGDINLEFEGGSFFLNYFNTRFPVKPESYYTILSKELELFKVYYSEENLDFLKFLGALYSAKNLPTDPGERKLHVNFVKKMLSELVETSPIIKEYIDRSVEIYNGEAGKPESFDLIDELHSEQNYRLSFWKVASEELNYRRFFTVNDLISLNINEEEVFTAVHKFISELIKDGLVEGLRIDHVDGLLDPTRYLDQLRSRFPDLYIVVEKILEHDENMPDSWQIEGTSGYEFLNYANFLFVCKNNEREFDEIYTDFIGEKFKYYDTLSDKKKLILNKYLAGDIANLAHFANKISNERRHGADFTIFGLRRALSEILMRMNVYRTYFNAEGCRKGDIEYLLKACTLAKQNQPDFQAEISFIEDIIKGVQEMPEGDEKDRRLYFVMRFQQLASPLMAKGFEDTFLYIYSRFISLNEVGGNPKIFGIEDEKFHEFNRFRAGRYPRTMNATSTHDTKRGEDVRMRLDVLSEIPKIWRETVQNWQKLNSRYKTETEQGASPDANDEYFLYQNMLGSLPVEEEAYDGWKERMREYITKAVREAKVYTHWLKPDEAYEGAYLSFFDSISGDEGFFNMLKEFAAKLHHFGALNSISNTLIKIFSPGAPDFYQGTELWDLTLVDPDNRRPVDYELRKKLLAEIEETLVRGEISFPEMFTPTDPGKVKLAVIKKGLLARNSEPELFQHGEYEPLYAEGEYADGVVAFSRAKENSELICVAGRYWTRLVDFNFPDFSTADWKGTKISIPTGKWRDAISGAQFESDGALELNDLLGRMPAAALVRMA